MMLGHRVEIARRPAAAAAGKGLSSQQNGGKELGSNVGDIGDLPTRSVSSDFPQIEHGSQSSSAIGDSRPVAACCMLRAKDGVDLSAAATSSQCTRARSSWLLIKAMVPM
ncbi:hypothetical protein CKAH01_04073 [Colletotrichum kahawae]|uniref:Uncharacterized protein n=1 Tax=Colletotrichum kahawae TaxID=34407 RepID=A0AAE0DAB1_COLKA|nr:hypothetical protein CKAH01_04073 [Colletotrichum kahawae]